MAVRNRCHGLSPCFAADTELDAWAGLAAFSTTISELTDTSGVERANGFFREDVVLELSPQDRQKTTKGVTTKGMSPSRGVRRHRGLIRREILRKIVEPAHLWVAGTQIITMRSADGKHWALQHWAHEPFLPIL